MCSPGSKEKLDGLHVDMSITQAVNNPHGSPHTSQAVASRGEAENPEVGEGQRYYFYLIAFSDCFFSSPHSCFAEKQQPQQTYGLCSRRG